MSSFIDKREQEWYINDVILMHSQIKIRRLDKMKTIWLVVPCYNEEEVLPLFYKEVVHTLEKIQNIDHQSS